MGERELREKYGGKLPKAINRAIRAEVPGGNAALDKLTQLAAVILQARWTDHAGRQTVEAKAYFKHKRDVVDKMEAQVRKAWGIKPEREAAPAKAAKPARFVKTGPRPKPAGKPARSQGFAKAGAAPRPGGGRPSGGKPNGPRPAGKSPRAGGSAGSGPRPKPAGKSFGAGRPAKRAQNPITGNRKPSMD